MAICVTVVQLVKQISFLMIIVFPQTSIVSPMELVKTQMQVRNSLSGQLGADQKCWQVCGQTDISGTVSHITRSAGFGGLFRGLGITATREVPAFAVYFSSYEVIVR